MNHFRHFPLIFLFWSFVLHQASAQTEILPLYSNGKIPLQQNCASAEKTDTTADGHPDRIYHVQKPEMWYWKTMKPQKKRVAVLIIPGGGYSFISMENEGRKVAQRLLNEGYDAFVLKYRLPDDACSQFKSWVPLTDAMAAVQKIRGYGYEKIGLIGFSAGGHLAGSLITMSYKNPHYPAVAPPDFACLVYPVVSLSEASHKGTRTALIGMDTAGPLPQQFSVEKQIGPKTPPTILIHSVDDSIVSYLHSELFFQASMRNKVHAEIHLYPSGGHGYGLGKMDNTEAPDWMPLTMFFFDRYR
jgi:acetyl esterase/lipase